MPGTDRPDGGCWRWVRLTRGANRPRRSGRAGVFGSRRRTRPDPEGRSSPFAYARDRRAARDRLLITAPCLGWDVFDERGWFGCPIPPPALPGRRLYRLRRGSERTCETPGGCQPNRLFRQHKICGEDGGIRRRESETIAEIGVLDAPIPSFVAVSVQCNPADEARVWNRDGFTSAKPTFGVKPISVMRWPPPASPKRTSVQPDCRTTAR
jgi:hypothetical protein